MLDCIPSKLMIWTVLCGALIFSIYKIYQYRKFWQLQFGHRHRRSSLNFPSNPRRRPLFKKGRIAKTKNINQVNQVRRLDQARLDMNHIWMSFSELMWCYAFVGINSVFAWIWGLIKLLFLGFDGVASFFAISRMTTEC